MNFTQITNYLEEKFHVVLDWTSETVFPILKDIAHRVAAAQLTKFSFLSFVCLMIIIGCIIYYVKCFKAFKTKDENSILITSSDYGIELSSGAFGMVIIVAFILIAAFGSLIDNVVKLINWVFVPEVELFKYVSSLF